MPLARLQFAGTRAVRGPPKAKALHFPASPFSLPHHHEEQSHNNKQMNHNTPNAPPLDRHAKRRWTTKLALRTISFILCLPLIGISAKLQSLNRGGLFFLPPVSSKSLPPSDPQTLLRRLSR